MSTDKKSLGERLFNFNNEDIKIPRTKKAGNAKYCPLDKLEKIIKPYCEKHGIGYYHFTTNSEGKNKLHTIVFNKDDQRGDYIESSTEIPEGVKLGGQNTLQVLGSSLTYIRRYNLSIMLNLNADTDNDGNASGSSSGSTVKKETDYVAIFKKQIEKGKTRDQVIKMVKSYEAQIPEAQKEGINKLIMDSYDKN